jgi:hypothetical protein
MATNIVLLDAVASPVTHTFVPIGPDEKGVFWFDDPTPNGATSAMGSWRISMELKRPPPAQPGQSSAGRTFRAIVGLHEPILEVLGTNTVSGIPPAATLAYTPRCFSEFILPERAVLLDRKNVRKMAWNLLNETQVIALVETLFKPF